MSDRSFCRSGKKEYLTEEEAKTELAALRGKPGRPEQSAYRCPYCDTWHLTSNGNRKTRTPGNRLPGGAREAGRKDHRG